MAGSYNHVVTEHGNLASPERVNGMLENGGDVFEAVEEMYGMIWWLAHALAAIDSIWAVNAVQEAHENYRDGLKLAKSTEGKGKIHGS